MLLLRCPWHVTVFIGADVNSNTTNNDHTVLSLACAGGHLSVVQYLLMQNADVGHVLKVNSCTLLVILKTMCCLCNLLAKVNGLICQCYLPQ